MNGKHVLYLITNKINNKKYVGITKNNVKIRWKQHEKSLFSIGYAIRKYGVDNFKFEILSYFDNREKAEEEEKNYIKKYNLTGKNGYNISLGGEGLKMTPKQHKETYKGTVLEWIPVKVYKIDGTFIGEFDSYSLASKITNVNSSSISQIVSKKRISSKGYCFFNVNEDVSKEYFQNLKTDNESGALKRQKAIICQNIETLETFHFDSILKASEKIGADNSNIVDCCKNEKLSAKGHIFCYLEEEHLLSDKLYKADKGVIGTNIKTGEVVIFNSPIEAKKSLGISNANIVTCCNGKKNQAGGYIWEYRKNKRKEKEFVKRVVDS